MSRLLLLNAAGLLAVLAAVPARAHDFIRCTAPDHSYSYLMRPGKPCPSPTDIQTDEDAIPQQPRLPFNAVRPTPTSVPATAPALVEKTICRPTFTVYGKPLGAGTAFVLRNPRQGGGALLVTAMHLFGPDGGWSTQIGWALMPAAVTAAQCTGLDTGNVLSAGKAYAIPGTGPSGASGAPLDMAALRLAGNPAPQLELADRTPETGDPVWLVARVVAGPEQETLMHRGRMLIVREGKLFFTYDNPALELQATSGAPIVDRDGHVVGVNTGGGHRFNTLIGSAAALDPVRKALSSLTP